MKERILNFFGLTTLKNLKGEVKYNDRCQKLLEKKINELSELEHKYNSLFQWELNKPEIDFRDYENMVGKSENKFGFDNKLFAEWYDLYRKDQYMAHKVRTLCEHPHLLSVFMIAFSKFDWNAAHQHMINADWYWSSGGKDRVPTVDEIKLHIFTLIHTKNLDVEGGVSSGGYELSFYNDEVNGATCIIEFTSMHRKPLLKTKISQFGQPYEFKSELLRHKFVQ